MVIVIEPHGTYAIYEQIVNQIKEQLMHGQLQADTPLPSVRTLAKDLKVSALPVKRPMTRRR